MTRLEIESALLEIMCSVFEVDTAKTTVTIDDMRNSFFVDSIAAVSLITELEDRFSMIIAAGDVTDSLFASFDNVCDYVQQKISNSNA